MYLYNGTINFSDNNFDDSYSIKCFNTSVDTFISVQDITIIDNDYDTYADRGGPGSTIIEENYYDIEMYMFNSSIKTFSGFFILNDSYLDVDSSNVFCFWNAINIADDSYCNIYNSTIQTEEMCTLFINGGAYNHIQNSNISSEKSNALQIATGVHHSNDTCVYITLSVLSGGSKMNGDPISAIYSASLEEMRDHVVISQSELYEYGFFPGGQWEIANYISITYAIEAEWWHSVARWTPYFIDDETEASKYRISLFFSKDDPSTATPIQEVIVENCEYDFTSYFNSIEPDYEGYIFTVMPLDSSNQPQFSTGI